MCSLQPHLLDFVQCIIAYEAFSCGAAVQSGVMRQDQNAVLGELEVELHNVRTHTDNGLDGRNGVFRVVPPITSVTSNYNILGRGVVNLCDDFLRPVRILRLIVSARDNAQCSNS